jgi:hypothetical protein
MLKRRRVKQTSSLNERLLEEAERLRGRARAMSPGIEQSELLHAARRHDVAIHMNEWLASPGLRPPE